MIAEEKEIRALLRLIDDPDQEVFETVADKLLDYGSGIIPQLESLWEITPDETVQERLEMLIHRVHFQMLQEDFENWNEMEEPDLLTGAILVARYQYPGLVISEIEQEIRRIERNIWLELNNYLTALEKINVLNSMIYSYFKLKGGGMSYEKPDRFFINKVMETRRGNALSIGILYQVLCQRLNIPVYAIGLPKQFILGYFDWLSPVRGTVDASIEQLKSNILFYIDPTQGQIFTGNDVDVYLKRLKLTPQEQYYTPQSVKHIIRLCLNELSLCFENKKEHYRYEELRLLAGLLHG